MKQFLDEDFLLNSDLAITIYDSIKNLNIIDYHCHLDPKEISENKHFKNITEIWLGGDHYKWRLMRANGISEDFITGNAPDYDKFLKWAETVEDLIGSPLYHWTHLELKRYFDYNELLTKETAPKVWEHCNKIISSGDFSVHSILEKFKVECLCTTDDPADDLHYHEQIKKSSLKTKVLPSFRPSKAFATESQDFIPYIKALSTASGIEISDYDSLKAALYQRIDFFHSMGCRLSDNALDPPLYTDYSLTDLNSLTKKALNGEKADFTPYKTALFSDLGKKYNELGWAMQIHMNAARNNNLSMYKKLGPDTGYDSILDTPITLPLSKLLDNLAASNSLPKTILYNLNPAADDVIATMTGNFQGGGQKGKIQYGAAWWFNDTKSGMEKQMSTLANHGLLSLFIGMLTDSRSFLSYTRHEYFRRILSNLLASWVQNGEFPNNLPKLLSIASAIAYHNAKNYFSF